MRSSNQNLQVKELSSESETGFLSFLFIEESLRRISKEMKKLDAYWLLDKLLNELQHESSVGSSLVEEPAEEELVSDVHGPNLLEL